MAAPRASFKGFIRLSLISIPVKGITATNTGGEVRLNQLHADCHSRIKYQKTCPTHGEVKSDQIVSGYEYSKDQYVIIDPDEVKKFRKESDKSVEIEGFIDRDQIDPKYFSGRTYYFLPDGPVGQKPYQLLRQVMLKDNLYAVAKAILSGREQIVILRPMDELLGMSVVTNQAKIKQTEQFNDELIEAKFSPEELNLTQTLIDASKMAEFDLGKYEDEYVNNMNKLIQAKVDGEEIVAAPDPEEPKVINLMEALKASVESARKPAAKGAKASGTAAKAKGKKVKSKLAPSAKANTTTKRKTKSG